jgi:hypothetical protein
MTEHWQYPSTDPVVSRAYTDALVAQDHSKAYAADTSFRFSSPRPCARAAGYGLAGVPATDAFDGPSLVVMGMGTRGHEDVQAAYAEKYPNAEFETKAQLGDLTSGHVDIDNADMDEITELKFVGAFKFDQAIGLQRKSYKRGDPKGPSLDHICQGGFNARSRGRSNVRIVYFSREAVSVPLSRKVGLTSTDRIAAEWVIPEDVWGPIVDAALSRLEDIRATVEQGNLPDREDWDDKAGKWFEPDPDAPRPHWRCNGYCEFAHQCRMDGPGVIPIPTRREP